MDRWAHGWIYKLNESKDIVRFLHLFVLAEVGMVIAYLREILFLRIFLNHLVVITQEICCLTFMGNFSEYYIYTINQDQS